MQLFLDFEPREVVPKFSAARFVPFLAYMGPFLVIFGLLEVSHFYPNMPLGVVKTGKKENLLANQK